MKNGLTRTQFFLKFHREEKSFFFWLPLGRLECYSVIIFLGFCIYSVYPRFLGLRCGRCDCFCTYDQSWSCILILFVNMDYVSWILFQWNSNGTWKVCYIYVSSPWCVLHMFVLHLLLNFILILPK